MCQTAWRGWFSGRTNRQKCRGGETSGSGVACDAGSVAGPLKLTCMPGGFPNWDAARPLDAFKSFTVQKVSTRRQEVGSLQQWHAWNRLKQSMEDRGKPILAARNCEITS